MGLNNTSIFDNSNTVILLAGGFGTRLNGVLNGVPKALADINGKPFLYYLLNNLINSGFSDFVFSLHYKSELIIDYLNSNKNGLLKNCQVRFLVEKSPLGTGGAISYINSFFNLGQYFYVVNADTYLDTGYSMLKSNNDNIMTLVEVGNTSRYGSVIFDQNHIIKNFVEKGIDSKNGFINAGFYKFSKSVFSNWSGNELSLENTIIPTLVKKGEISVEILNSNFIDIGIPEDYRLFCKIMS